MRRVLPERMAHRLTLLVALAITVPALAADAMPDDFVYLRDIDPTIQQDMRYAGSRNFTGKPVDGYEAPECVLVRQAAEALQKVQADLRGKGLTLKIYDCYRPARAVAAFVAWSEASRRSDVQGDVVSPSDQRRPVPRLHRHALGPFARRDARSHFGAGR